MLKNKRGGGPELLLYAIVGIAMFVIILAILPSSSISLGSNKEFQKYYVTRYVSYGIDAASAVSGDVIINANVDDASRYKVKLNPSNVAVTPIKNDLTAGNVYIDYFVKSDLIGINESELQDSRLTIIKQDNEIWLDNRPLFKEKTMPQVTLPSNQTGQKSTNAVVMP